MFTTQDKREEEILRLRLSQTTKAALKNMQPVLKLRIKASIRAAKGSIFYFQKAS